jgi:predicted deacylase
MHPAEAIDVHSEHLPRARREVDRLLAPLSDLAARSEHLLSRSSGQFDAAGPAYSLPRYVFFGPRGGGDTIRIGIFATIHGDEPEGALGLTRFVEALSGRPDLARGYGLFLYPMCNPTGFEDRTRVSRSGKDLNREFWRGSSEPEVCYLEQEIVRHAFHGIITLHSDDTSPGLYGFATGAVLSEYLLEPALRAAERFLPRNHGPVIDGFAARRGIINDDIYQGVLRSPNGLAQPPFEITFETPQLTPPDLQSAAVDAALRTILIEYRSLMALAQNI